MWQGSAIGGWAPRILFLCFATAGCGAAASHGVGAGGPSDRPTPGPTDLGGPSDLAAGVDSATPPDLTAPADLTPSPDLVGAPDFGGPGCEDFSLVPLGVPPADFNPLSGTWEIVADGSGHALSLTTLGIDNSVVAWRAPLQPQFVVTAEVDVQASGSLTCLLGRAVDPTHFTGLCVSKTLETMAVRDTGSKSFPGQASVMLAPGLHELRLEVDGATMRGYVDGLQLSADATDALPLDAPVGLYGGSADVAVRAVCLQP
jgi:hypothetical protein